MSKLPPVEKLPLALRKNIRDDWDNKKLDLEQQISNILTVPWTVDVNPNQLYAYATEGYAKESLGSCIAGYITGAAYRLKEFVDHAGEEGLKELNTICSAHTITIDLDDTGRFPYCGVDIHEGKLRILFAPERLGVNIDDAINRDILLKALNEAPAPTSEDKLSFAARSDIRNEYEPRAEAIRAEIGQILEKPDIKLNPNFESTFAKLREESEAKKIDIRSDWENVLGSFTRMYWEGLVTQLKCQKFDQDELLREGFHEAVEKGEIAFRIVDQLKYDSYCECDIEDGVLYLQCTAKNWGTNIDNAAEKLVDRL
ncbi:uncharacterized protein F4822DRAFT_337359 [Hypoxylon trugodes]|uniref:uncharacterized protein n=1 Tax=Hypoxylon trugodes TaxID=326681 RepID=UPI00218CFF56|nr:uncharacterized protein F4822DRAFT_337359 [Hypoxylon trugodes]KAI1385209.1 hypothetical protein F4822DRAFT_337359 [Hypoxylon trugodes]